MSGIIRKTVWGMVYGMGIAVGAMNFGNTGCDSPVAEAIGEDLKQELNTPTNSPESQTPATVTNEASTDDCLAMLQKMKPYVGDPSPAAQCTLGMLQLEYMQSGCDEHATQQDIEVTQDLIEFFCDLAKK
jgi:hypothetical protein